MKKAFLIGILAVLSVHLSYSQKNAKPIISSHNFSTKMELWESIGTGIINFQADVMYIYGNVYVTPVMPDSANHKMPTLMEAYVYPLYNQYKKNNSEIIPGYQGDVFLILNFVAQPVQIYRKMASELSPLAEMLTYKIESADHQGKLRILIKDKMQYEKINNIKPCFLGLVGGLDDIDKNIDSKKMPLIEVDFNEISSWKGTGNIPFEDFMKIKDMIAKVHAQNKKISINNCPSNKAVADFIKTSKADFINTPEAIRMAEFFEGTK